MELDPTLAQPHTELATLKESLDWDWAGAEAEFRKAIELNPNDATVHHWYSVLLQNLGRIAEASEEIHKAQALDPASPQIKANVAGILIVTHRYDEAIGELNKPIASDPDFATGYGYRAWTRWRQGNQEAFIADLATSQLKGGRADAAETLRAGYGKGGLKGACSAMIEFLMKKSRTEYVSPYGIAVFYAVMGDLDHTFEYLEKAYREHSGRMEYIKDEDAFEGLRSDPRYVDLLRRMGLPQ